MSPGIRLEGYVDDGRGQPLSGIPAVARRLADGVEVDTTLTDITGYWDFTDLPTSDEYVVTLSDTSGNAVARAPWSGELRTAWVRDRLDVAGKPVLLDPAAGNSLLWTTTGLYAPTGLTSTEADALFLTPAEGNAAYATAAHNHDTAYVQLTGGSVMTGLLGPSTHNTRDLGTTGVRWRALYGMTGDFTTSLTVATKPITPSPDAANIIEFRANGLYAAAGAVTDIWVNTTGDTMTGDLNMTANVLPTVTNVRSLGSTSLRWLKVWATDADFTNAPTVGGAALLTSTTADALFLTPAEGNAAYATAAHNHDATYVQLVGGSVMTGLLGPTTTNTRDLGTTALRWRKLWAVDGEFTNAPTVGGSALLTATTADALFLTPAEGNAAYATAAHNHDATYVQLVGGSVMTGLLGPTTTNTRDLGTSALRWRKLWGVDADLSGALTVTTGPLTVSAGGIAVTGASTFSVAPTVGGSALLTATTADALFLTPAEGDTAYVNATSDTMSGTLGVGGLLTASAGLAVTGAATISTTLSVNSRPVIMAGCRVYHNAAQSIATSTSVLLAFNSERYDTDGFHDPVTNNSRLTVPAGLAGKYLIFATIQWAANADSNIRGLQLLVNGATNIAIETGPALALGSQPTRQTLATVYDLAVGDYVHLTVFQASGVALDISAAGNYSPEFGMQRIG